MKKKDPIKALEFLKDWNKCCAKDFYNMSLKYDDNCKWIPKIMAQIFQENYNILFMIIAELKKN